MIITRGKSTFSSFHVLPTLPPAPFSCANYEPVHIVLLIRTVTRRSQCPILVFACSTCVHVVRVQNASECTFLETFFYMCLQVVMVAHETASDPECPSNRWYEVLVHLCPIHWLNADTL